MEPDLRRIALVTRRFTELRGLYWVAGGVWLLLLLAQANIPALRAAQGRFAVLSTSFVLTIFLLNRYYTRRFGRVGLPDDDRFWWTAWMLIIGVVVDQITYTRGVPSVTFFMLAATSIGTVIRDWPFRAHHLVLCVAALFASLSFAEVTGDAPRRFWMREILLLMAAALIATGFFDHWLLVRTLPGATARSVPATAHESSSDADTI